MERDVVLLSKHTIIVGVIIIIIIIIIVTHIHHHYHNHHRHHYPVPGYNHHQYQQQQYHHSYHHPHQYSQIHFIVLINTNIIIGYHTFVIFQMKHSFGSSPVESSTSNSDPKSQNAQLNTPCTPALINCKLKY